MKKQKYIEPETVFVKLRTAEPVLLIGDLFTGSAKEDSKDSWVGGKSNELWEDDNEENAFMPDSKSLWDD